MPECGRCHRRIRPHLHNALWNKNVRRYFRDTSYNGLPMAVGRVIQSIFAFRVGVDLHLHRLHSLVLPVLSLQLVRVILSDYPRLRSSAIACASCWRRDRDDVLIALSRVHQAGRKQPGPAGVDRAPGIHPIHLNPARSRIIDARPSGTPLAMDCSVCPVAAAPPCPRNAIRTLRLSASRRPRPASADLSHSADMENWCDKKPVKRTERFRPASQPERMPHRAVFVTPPLLSVVEETYVNIAHSLHKIACLSICLFSRATEFDRVIY